MAIESSIYSQIRAPQQTNRLAQFAQMQQIEAAQSQNRLAELSYGEKEREIGADKAMAGFISRGEDVSKGLASQGYGKQSIAYTKDQQAALKQRGEVDKQNVDLIDSKLKQSRSFLEGITTPEQYIAWHEGNHKDPVLGPALAARGVTADQARATITAALSKPGGFEELLKKSAVGIEKFTEMNKPTFQTRNTGGTTDTLQIPGMGGAPTVVNSIRNTQSPDSVASTASAAASRAQSAAQHTATMGKPFEVTGPDGVPVLVRQDKQGNITPVQGYGPKAGTEKPLTDAQSKAALFGSRMESSNKVLESLATDGTTTSIPGARAGFGIGATLNVMTTAKQQQLSQAKRDFVNAVLRRESGAVIAESEFNNAEIQYFPQVGDSAEVQKQKANNRAIAIRGIQAEVPKAQRGVLREIQDGRTGTWGDSAPAGGKAVNFGDLK